MPNCERKDVFEAYSDNHFSVSRDSDKDGITISTGANGRRHEVFYWDFEVSKILDCLKEARKEWKIEK